MFIYSTNRRNWELSPSGRPVRTLNWAVDGRMAVAQSDGPVKPGIGVTVGVPTTVVYITTVKYNYVLMQL